MTALTKQQLVRQFEDVIGQLNEHESLDVLVQRLGFDLDEFFSFVAVASRHLDERLADQGESDWPPVTPFDRMLGLNFALSLGLVLGMRVEARKDVPYA